MVGCNGIDGGGHKSQVGGSYPNQRSPVSGWLHVGIYGHQFLDRRSPHGTTNATSESSLCAGKSVGFLRCELHNDSDHVGPGGIFWDSRSIAGIAVVAGYFFGILACEAYLAPNLSATIAACIADTLLDCRYVGRYIVLDLGRLLGILRGLL